MHAGYSRRSLDLYKQFYETHKKIRQTLSAKSLELLGDIESVPMDLMIDSRYSKEHSQVPAVLSQVSKSLFQQFSLSWSHYVCLMSIKDKEEQSFYEIEAIKMNWSLRELRRQINSSLYERLALSRDKKEVMRLSQMGQIVSQPGDLIKSPVVLEFLNLQEQIKYSESDLETAIINKLEQFLLELGKGFLFAARQKRFTFDDDNYYVDLVFYNRMLRCYTLIDLKIGDITHQDLGQMQMYVNYFDRYEKIDDESRTIGIVICRKNKESMVEITLPEDSNIHASEYKLYLPSKAELKKQLEEAKRDWEEEHDE